MQIITCSLRKDRIVCVLIFVIKIFYTWVLHNHNKTTSPRFIDNTVCSLFLTWSPHCIYTGENNEDAEFLYYMNEGVYGPFSRKLLGNSIAAPSVHKVSRPPSKGVNPIQN